MGRDVTLFPQVFLQIFEKTEIDILLGETTKNDSIFWDVGANVGIYSILFAKNFPKSRVLAFEPNPRVIERLQKNLDLNNLSNVEVMKFGLSDSEKNAKLFLNEVRAGAGTLAPNQLHDSMRFTEIKVKTALQVLEKFPEFIPDLIKIDVEGFEPEVLRGFGSILSVHKPKIFLEYFPNLWSEGRKEQFHQVLNYMFDLYGSVRVVSEGEIEEVEDFNLDDRTIGLSTLIFG